MKIAFFHLRYNGTGGLERFLSVWADYFINQGHEIIFLSLNESGDFPFPLNPKVQFIAMNEPIRRTRLRKYLIAYRIYKIIKKEKIDIVIGQMLKPSVILGWTSKLFGIKAIGMEHFAFNSENHPKKWLKQRPLYYKYLSAFVCLTQEDLLSYKSVGVDNVKLIFNPVNLPQTVTYNIKSQTIITVGRQEHQKNLSALVRCFHALSVKWPLLKLQIIGKDYGERNNLIQLSKELNVFEKIEYVDFTHDIAPYYQNASFFVLSSIYEGLPVSLIEAKAFGLPCVSFDCPTGPKHIIKHNEDGFLAPLHNEELLTQYMETLISNPELRKEMSSKARVDAFERFSTDKLATQWNELFTEILNR